VSVSYALLANALFGNSNFLGLFFSNDARFPSFTCIVNIRMIAEAFCIKADSSSVRFRVCGSCIHFYGRS